MGAEVNGQLIHSEEVEPRQLAYHDSIEGELQQEVEAQPVEASGEAVS